MRDVDTLNNIADIILLVSLPAVLYFTVSYGLRAPWWKSLIGIMFFSLGAALSIFDAIVLLSLFLGPDYPGRPIIRIFGYVLLTLSLYFICIVYEVERRTPNSVLPSRLPGELRKLVGSWWGRTVTKFKK